MRYTLCWAVMLDCITLYKCCYYCIHPIAVCCSVMYTSPEMLDCDQQGEVRLKEWNLPVTDTQCAGWCVKLLVVCSRFSSEPLSPLKLHSFSNSFLRCVRAHPLGASNNCTSECHTLYPLPPESGYRISPRGGSQPHQPPRRGGNDLMHRPLSSFTQRFYSHIMQEVNSGCARLSPWRWHPSKSAWILHWKPPERKDGRKSSHRTSEWAEGTVGKGQRVIMW